MKKIEYKGHFWLNNSKNIVYGYLKWFNEIAYLELLSNPDPDKRIDYEVESMCGILNGQSAITIVNCKLKRFSFPYGDYIVNFDYLIYGHGKNWNSEAINLHKFKINYDHLFTWANLRGIESEGQGREVKIKRADVDFNPILFDGPGFILRIGYVTEFPIATYTDYYTAKQETYIEIEDKSNINLDDIINIIKKLTFLLKLLTSSNFKCDSIIKSKDDNNKDYSLIINRFYSGHNSEDNVSDNYLFTYKELINNGLDIAIGNFYSASNDYFENIEIFVSCIENDVAPKQYIFLNLMYTLDILANQKHKNKYATLLSLDDRRHLDILTAKDVPLNTSEYFRAKIERSNYSKLKERLLLYLNSFEFITKTQLPLSIKNLVEITVNTRNDLSHDTRKTPILNHSQFAKINELLINWISLILLKNLGLEDEMLIEKIQIYNS